MRIGGNDTRLREYGFLSAALLLCLIPCAALAQKDNYLFAYFKNNGEDGLHLAHSTDGLSWRALNGDKSLLTPVVGSQKLMRDPCIVEGPDGLFHLVWTTGWDGRDIGIAHSSDLINWSEQKAIPVMQHEPATMNCWAPEIFYDKPTRKYLIFWASTIPGRFPKTDGSAGKGRNHRIYFTSTSDFVTYAPTALYYDAGFNVIDATLVKEGRDYLLIVKDETELPVVRKHLRIARGKSAAGPFGDASEPFTIDWVEGPAALKLKGEWIVFYDMYRDHRYGAVKTRDWKTWQTVTPELTMPPGLRHGTAFRVSNVIVSRLLTL